MAAMENRSGNLERSVSAMAILLIMAGDVEQNPGPLGQQDLRTVSKYLTSLSEGDLKMLGMALGLYQQTVWGYGNMSLPEFRYKLLGDWVNEKDGVRGCGGATWSSLVKALRDEEVRQNGIAQEIEAEQIKDERVPKPKNTPPSSKQMERSPPPPVKLTKHPPPSPSKQTEHSPPPLNEVDKATVKAIIEKECTKEEDGSLKLSLYALQLLHRNGDYGIIDGCPLFLCTDKNSIQDFSVLGHCIASSNYKWRLVLGDRRCYMQSTDRIDVLVETLRNQSNPSYTIEKITCYYNAPECVQRLLLELPQYALEQIQTLVLYGNIRNPQPLSQCVLEHVLSKMSSLQELRLLTGALSTKGAIAIAETVTNNTSLRLIQLIKNNIDDEGMKALDRIKDVKEDLKLYVQW